MEQCFFDIQFEVERDQEGANGHDDNDDGNDNPVAVDEEEDLGDDFAEQVEKARTTGNSGMDIEQTPVSGRGVQANQHANVQTLEASVMERVMGKCTYSQALQIGLGDKSVEENVGRQLIQELNEESDDEEDAEQDVTQQMVFPKARGKRAWGPVQATRMSTRISRDGKSVIEKAQELKKAKNLEKPTGKIHGFANSFAALEDNNLVSNAKAAGISLGVSSDIVKMNVDLIRGVESKRLEDFHSNHPDMFLPSDINLTMEDILEVEDDCSEADSDYHEDHISDVCDSEWPWTVISNVRKSRKKLQFK
jgi:hypothetical protein